MLPQIRSELLKLTTIRTSLYFVLVTVLFVAGIVVIQAVTAGGEFSGPLGDPATQQSLFTTAAAAPLIAIVFGCLAITSELRHKTIVPTLLFEAGRVKVVVAKSAATLVAGAALGAVAVIVGGGLTMVILLATSTTVAVSVGSIAATSAGTVGAAALGALFGLGIGGLVRNQALAVGTVLVLMLAVEPMVASLLPDLAAWLPSSLVTTTAEARTGVEVGVWLAAPALALYAVAVTTGAALRLRMADVT